MKTRVAVLSPDSEVHFAGLRLGIYRPFTSPLRRSVEDDQLNSGSPGGRDEPSPTVCLVSFCSADNTTLKSGSARSKMFYIVDV